MSMDVTNVVTYVAGLSVATERITETITRVPWFSPKLSDLKETKQGENWRVIGTFALAAVVGGILCWQTPTDLLPEGLHGGIGLCVFFGVLASGGSGFWNNAVDSLREIKKQRQDPRRKEVAEAEAKATAKQAGSNHQPASDDASDAVRERLNPS